MKAKTVRTLLMTGTIIGGVMYFSQTAKAQDTKLQTMTTENRMLYNTKEELAQQVTGASNEFAIQAGLENQLRNTEATLRQKKSEKAALDQLIQQKLANGTWASAEDLASDPAYLNLPIMQRVNDYKNKVEPLNDALADQSRLATEIASLTTGVTSLVNSNFRSGSYRINNFSQVI